MLSTVAGVLYKTPSGSWDMKELEGWEMGGRRMKSLMKTSMKSLMNDVHWDRWESRHSYYSEAMHRVYISS